MFIGFHEPLKSWANILVFVCVFISIGTFSGIIYSWGKELRTRVPAGSARGYFIPNIFVCLTEDECCCVLYLSCAFVTIVMVPCITGIVRLYKWEQWNLVDLCVNIYALAGFSVLSGVIPGRYRQHMAHTHIERKIQENHDTIRYISHEIRSPLNIVKNGVKLVINNLTGHCHPDILEDLADIEHASCAATSIIDDLLNFEKMEAKSFQVERHYEPAASRLTEMANRCQALAQQKQINFEVQNKLDFSGVGDSLFILVDVIKMEQVIRNLIINSIKFTPKGGHIFVLFRHEASSVHTGVPDSLPGHTLFASRFQVFKALLKQIKGWWFAPEKQKVHVDSQNNCISIQESKSLRMNGMKVYDNFGKICIDITDTGAGLSPSQLKQVFGKFVQFNANHLQGGGGSGLGLWICKSIVEQHEGIITLKSDGLDLGATFTIQINCYLESSLENRTSFNAAHSHHSIAMNSCTEVPKTSLHFDASYNLRPFANSFAFNVQECQSVSQFSIDSSLLQSVGTPSNASYAIDTLENKPIKSPINILVVDDSDLNRKIMKNMINKNSLVINEKHGISSHFEIFEADDGTSALEMMKSRSYGLILIDNIMTHMNGPQAVGHMRQLGYNGLIMGVTGAVSEADIDDFISHGASAVLKKPISIEMLFQVLLDLAF